MRIGVLGLQGGFAAHIEALRGLGHEATEVRTARGFDALEGLVLPGGESSAQWRLLNALSLAGPLAAFVRSGLPVLATCAGAILLATHVTNPAQESLGAIDIDVERNAWGTQQDSFEVTSDEGLPLVFIRAPRILRVGSHVQVLARFRGEPVMVREGHITCATFHPELAEGARLVHDQAFRA